MSGGRVAFTMVLRMRVFGYWFVVVLVIVVMKINISTL